MTSNTNVGAALLAVGHSAVPQSLPPSHGNGGRHVLVVADMPTRYIVECGALSVECQWWDECTDCIRARRGSDPRLQSPTHKWIEHCCDGEGDWIVALDECRLANPTSDLDLPELAHLAPGRYPVTRFWWDSFCEDHRLTVDPAPLAQ